VTQTPNDRASAARRSPTIAAVLSFLWPGLGHAYVRRWALAAAFGIPPLVLAAYLLWLARDGIEYLAAALIVPSFALALTVLAIGFIGWRLVALGHSWGLAGTAASRRRPSARVALVLAAVLILTSQGVIGYYAWAVYDASSQIFSGDVTPSPSPGQALASPSPSDGAGANFEGGPVVTPTPSSRINVLVTGIDAYRTRSEALNDTLLVVSFDPVAKTAVLISIPRDTSAFPLYSGGTYSGKINSLMTAAYNSPSKYPDGPVTTLTKEIGYLLGVPIQYYAAIDLTGFKTMVDLVGGIDVVNPKAIDDPAYDWLDGTHGFKLSAGPHHLDGRTALAYVRSRQGQGDNDYTRSARQQQVLIALKQKMATPAMIAKLPQVLGAAAKTIKTNFPAEDVASMVAVGQEISTGSIQKFVLGPPYNYHPPSTETGGVWTSRLYMDKISKLSIKLFGTDSSYWTYNPYGPTGESMASPSPLPAPTSP
jgi:polyisoprenyl-teichoic acid--peptidoglycan teichoic acid transferase